ncbi:dihydroflavonol-4-reductase [Furfurilactobacillus siliginis]|uniref:Dihydroflavonol-4-reductase n=1 Tax=Furfurilactobacillus siliginis TaxID=348151 RepID=A0A0R2L1Z7_9LACO|nr:hypothetical protein [Furfurilactobacillus siliginis]KRN93877.1 dihydroflavonol-4-reductase [Furfurilactobacillus siliginis]
MKSKTVEERRAWELINDAQKNVHDVKMTAINPAFVLGPSLVPWARYSAIQMKQLLQIPFALPMQGYAVDVRDVAAMQVALMQTDAADGTRNLAMGMPMSMADLKRIMVTDFRDQSIRSAMIPIPAWLLLPLRGTTTGADFYPRFKGQVTYQPLHPEFYQYQYTNLRVSVDEMMTQLLKDKQIGPQQQKIT